MTLRQRNSVIIVVVILFMLALRVSSTSSMPSAPYFDGTKPYVIAHQGGDGIRPGNTLLALRHAHTLGADVLEMDVHASRDGVVVLMHDESVDRTTDGSGLLREKTLAEIEKLDAAFHWPYEGEERLWRGRGVGVPTLQQVLTEFPDARFNIEIKQAEPSIVATVCGLLRRHGAVDRSLVASFDEDTIVEFRSRCPGIATSAVQAELRWFLLFHHIRLLGFYQPAAHALQVPPRSRLGDLATPEIVASAARRGMYVDVWTVNDEAGMAKFIEAGVAGIITDRPDLMLKLLGRKR